MAYFVRVLGLNYADAVLMYQAERLQEQGRRTVSCCPYELAEEGDEERTQVGMPLFASCGGRGSSHSSSDECCAMADRLTQWRCAQETDTGSPLGDTMTVCSKHRNGRSKHTELQRVISGTAMATAMPVLTCHSKPALEPVLTCRRRTLETMAQWQWPHTEVRVRHRTGAARFHCK